MAKLPRPDAGKGGGVPAYAERRLVLNTGTTTINDEGEKMFLFQRMSLPNATNKVEIPKDPQEKIANSMLLQKSGMSINDFEMVLDARLVGIANGHPEYFKSKKFGFSFDSLVGQEIALFGRFYSDLNGKVGMSMREDIRNGFSKFLSGADLDKAVDEHILILSFVLARASTNLKTSAESLKFSIEENGMLLICSGVSCLSADILKQLHVGRESATQQKSATYQKSATSLNKWLDLAKNGDFDKNGYEQRFSKGSWANLQKVATSIYYAYLKMTNAPVASKSIEADAFVSPLSGQEATRFTKRYYDEEQAHQKYDYSPKT